MVLQHAEIKRILRNEYGWPDNFRKNTWIGGRERIWYELKHRFKVENWLSLSHLTLYLCSTASTTFVDYVASKWPPTTFSNMTIQQRTSTLTKLLSSFLTWLSSPLQSLWRTQFSSRKWTHHELKRPDYIPAKWPINATRIFSGPDQFKLNSIIISIWERNEIARSLHVFDSR